MRLLPHVALLPDRILNTFGLPDGSFLVSTYKGVFAVDANLVVGPKVVDDPADTTVLPDGRLVVKASPMRVGTIGALESIDIGTYLSKFHATADGFVVNGSDRIVIEKAGKRATIPHRSRYVKVIPVNDTIVVTSETGLQIFDPSGEELARSGEVYLTKAAIAIGKAFVVGSIRSLVVFDDNAQKIGQREVDDGDVRAFSGGLIVAPTTTSGHREGDRTRIQFFALDRETLRDRWFVNAPRTKSIDVIGDRLVLTLDGGVWIIDATGHVLAQIDGLGWVGSVAAFEDGIAITGGKATKWWRPSGITELEYEGSLSCPRTVPVGLATAEWDLLQIWRTDMQGPEPVPLTTDLPIDVPIVVDGRPMVIEGTNRFTLRARMQGDVLNLSPRYTSWRHLTTGDEAGPILERLIARRFDGPLPAIPSEGQSLEKSTALSQLPLAQTVDLVGRGLFGPSLELELAKHANNLRRAFLSELAIALGTRPRLLLAAIHAQKIKLDSPRVIPSSYDYLGMFTSSGELTAADPCYLGKKSTGISFTQKLDALEGLWHSFVRSADGAPAYNAEIVVVHDLAFAVNATSAAGEIVVDAGLAGVFDKACPKPNLDYGLDDGTVNGLGAVVSSGQGDSMYPVFVGKQSGKVAKIRIVFIDDAPTIDRFSAQPIAGTGKPYSPKEKFAAGDTIEHVKFGVGSVIRAADGKIDVQFSDETRTLVHAKK